MEELHKVAKKERNIMWDNYKGILIFLVVFAHFLYAYSKRYAGSVINNIVTIIYMFHMPAFIFCSGYFSKSEKTRNKEKIFKLFLYYIIFNSSMMIFMKWYNGMEFDFLSPYNSYWYIISLIFWRLSIKYLDKIKYILFFSIIIAFLIGYHDSFTNILSIRRTIVFFPFFLLGYKFSNNEILKWYGNVLKNKNWIKIVSCLIILLVVFSTVIILVNKFNFTESMLLMRAYKSDYDILFRFLIFIIAFIITLLIPLLMPNRKIILLSQVGKNSIGIYLFHRFFTYLFLLVFKEENYSNWLILYGFVASILTMMIFGSNLFNKFLNNLLEKLANNITEENMRGNILKTICISTFILILLFNPISNLIKAKNNNIKNGNGDGSVFQKSPEVSNK